MRWLNHYRETIYSCLVAGIIFLIPTNLFFKTAASTAYVHGLLVDYLLPKLYPSDILVIILLLLWLTEVPFKEWWLRLKTTSGTGLLFFGATAALGLRQLAAPYPLAAMWFWLVLVECVVLGLFLLHHQSLFKQKLLSLAVILAIVFQAAIGLYQFFTQRSLWGYWLLGEPNLSRMIGVAKFEIGGAILTAPYGTTAHPNVLAGCLAVLYLLLIFNLHRPLLQKKRWPLAVLGAVVIFILYTTQSWSAAATLALGGAFIWLRYTWLLIGGSVGLFVAMPVLLQVASSWSSSTSIVRRVWLNSAAIKVLAQHPLRGSGLNNFTAVLETASSNPEVVRFVQPVHHVGLLWAAETGVLGLLWIAALVAALVKRLTRNDWTLLAIKVAIILPIAAADHYLLSLHAGLMLLTFWLCWPTSLFDKSNHTRV